MESCGVYVPEFSSDPVVQSKLKRKIEEDPSFAQQLEAIRRREVERGKDPAIAIVDDDEPSKKKKREKEPAFMTPEEYREFEYARGEDISLETAASMVAELREWWQTDLERMGFLEDILPLFNVVHGSRGRNRYPDKKELRAVRDNNYLNLAKLAIAVYNVGKNVKLDVEKVEEVKIVSKSGTNRIVYDMSFTAKDVKTGGCDPSNACKTFQTAVDIDLGREVEKKKIISCSPKHEN